MAFIFAIEEICDTALDNLSSSSEYKDWKHISNLIRERYNRLDCSNKRSISKKSNARQSPRYGIECQWITEISTIITGSS